MIRSIGYAICYIVFLLGIWATIVWFFEIPHFILPSPDRVIFTLFSRSHQLAQHAITTGIEIISGLFLGAILGFITACWIGDSKLLQRAAMPLLVVSQALPVFALAPLLMLWLGYGLASKLAMTTLIVFFPVTAATLAGFRQFPEAWEDTFKTLRPKKKRLFWLVRLPLAIPHALSGLRIAASVAPIGAVVGEWVGSSSGLGYLMLQSNARGQTDLMFAALVVLSIEAVLIWSVVNRLSRRFDHYSTN
ncbi:ABC transporter permease [Litorivicinus sp.]|nr:ABC transporter permease [Litorivicinus sp.]